MRYEKLFNIIFIGLILTSCGARNQASNYLVKYQEAEARYAAKDYYEALRLYKEVIPLLRGKKEIIQAHFHQAYAYFYQKNYPVSEKCFKHFYKNYPRLPQAEEALYMQGYVLHLAALDVELDQQDTQKAIKVFNTYLSKYPNGNYQKEALQYLKMSKDKLAAKAFLNAKLYYKLGHYQAAVIALTNFQQDYPGSIYQEKSAYTRIKAQYKLAKSHQVKEEQANKLRSTITYCQEFLENYPNSPHKKSVQEIYEATLGLLDKIIQV